MKKKFNLKIIGYAFFSVFLVISILFDGVPLILGDGYSYYHPAKTLVEEGKFISSTKPEYLQYAGENISYYEEKYVTRVNPGTSLLIAPFLAGAKPFDNGTIYRNYHKAFIGHSLADGIAVLFASVLYTLAGAFFVVKSLEILGFSSNKAILSTILAYLSSHLFAYTLEFPAYTHSYEFFALAGFFYFALKLKKSDRDYLRFALLTGVFIGIAVLVRTSLLLCAAPVVVYSLWREKDIIKKILTIGIGGLPFTFVFFHYNYTAYGGILSNGYSVLHDQNPDLTRNHTINMLFSATRGWFVYSPLTLLSIYGLFNMMKKHTQTALALLAAIGLSIIFFSFWPWWWSGYSIGQRFFLGLLPFVAVGIAQVLKKADTLKPTVRKAFYLAIILLTGYSLSVTILHRITPASDLPEILNRQGKHEEVPDDEEFSPLDFFRYHVKILEKSSSADEYATTLSESLNGGRSLILLAAGLTEPIAKIEQINESEFYLHFIPNSTNSEISADISVSIDHKGEIHGYLLKNIDFSKHSKAKFRCSEDVCTTDWDDATSLENEPEEDQICFSDELCVKLSSDSRIKFVDYRYAK